MKLNIHGVDIPPQSRVFIDGWDVEERIRADTTYYCHRLHLPGETAATCPPLPWEAIAMAPLHYGAHIIEGLGHIFCKVSRCAAPYRAYIARGAHRFCGQGLSDLTLAKHSLSPEPTAKCPQPCIIVLPGSDGPPSQISFLPHEDGVEMKGREVASLISLALDLADGHYIRAAAILVESPTDSSKEAINDHIPVLADLLPYFWWYSWDGAGRKRQTIMTPELLQYVYGVLYNLSPVSRDTFLAISGRHPKSGSVGQNVRGAGR